MALGFPSTFPGSYTTGSLVIGAVQKAGTGALGFPSTFPGAYTTGYETIGAVQKTPAAVAVRVYPFPSMKYSDV